MKCLNGGKCDLSEQDTVTNPSDDSTTTSFAPVSTETDTTTNASGNYVEENSNEAEERENTEYKPVGLIIENDEPITTDADPMGTKTFESVTTDVAPVQFTSETVTQESTEDCLEPEEPYTTETATITFILANPETPITYGDDYVDAPETTDTATITFILANPETPITTETEIPYGNDYVDATETAITYGDDYITVNAGFSVSDSIPAYLSMLLAFCIM